MALVIVLIATILFAAQAIRAKRLLFSALWLAGTSALLSIVLYMMDAQLVAVIELSVGAGLVTVLFVFAISIAGDEAVVLRSLVPVPLAVGLALMPIFLIAWFALPLIIPREIVQELPPSLIIWQQRGMDVFVQVVFIFAGVLGLLGLLGEVKAPLQYPVAEEVAAQRERELQTLQQQSLELEKEAE